jgi:glycosyltransferase involved in cell wall biosynthesis
LHVPLGVNTDRFRPANDAAAHGPPRLLAVGDFREHRKRPDLLLGALELTLAARPDVLPVLVGRDSDRLELPKLMSARCERLGYVSADELLRQYRSAHAFLLLSDFEAFGLPIAEALCCGTPVVMHAQAETVAAFGDLPGVTAIPNTALDRVRDALLACAASPPDRSRIANAAADRFSLTATYGRKLDRVITLLDRAGDRYPV